MEGAESQSLASSDRRVGRREQLSRADALAARRLL
jgi:hypothetical protein